MILRKTTIYHILNFLIGLVWLVNGLICKIFNLVPRHHEIVSNILGQSYASIFTLLIGISEVIMAIWVWSKFKSKWNSVTQIALIITMNIIEFITVPELLLWGRTNALFALLFVCIIYINEFILKHSNH